MLFQGEEWGATTPFLYFTDHQDAKLGEMVRQGRRRDFAAHGWNEGEIPDPQARETFERGKLNWAERLQSSHAELLEWHRQLIALRQAEPSLRDGRMDRVQTRHDESERWLVVERGPFVVACNLGDEPKAIPLPAGRYEVLMASVPIENPDILPPDSVAVMKCD
jgi:maltooligosyltrehalose trehalohydrolase